MAQEVEHFLGKEEVTGSNPVSSSSGKPPQTAAFGKYAKGGFFV